MEKGTRFVRVSVMMAGSVENVRHSVQCPRVDEPIDIIESSNDKGKRRIDASLSSELFLLRTVRLCESYSRPFSTRTIHLQLELTRVGVDLRVAGNRGRVDSKGITVHTIP